MPRELNTIGVSPQWLLLIPQSLLTDSFGVMTVGLRTLNQAFLREATLCQGGRVFTFQPLLSNNVLQFVLSLYEAGESYNFSSNSVAW